MINISLPSIGSTQARSSGFTLIEIMVALTLGLLLSIGILSLFGSTSRTNRLQNGLARLQENGRFAVTRMETDLRMTSGQYCSNSAGATASAAVVPVIPARAPFVLAPHLGVPDPGPNASDGGQALMNSIDASGYPTDADTTAGYAISPRYFVQGYSCAGGTCTPAGLPSDLPGVGTDAGDRLEGSDVLTVRYQRGTGWAFSTSPAASTCASGQTLTLRPEGGDDLVNFAAGDLAVVSNCINPSIVPIGGIVGNALTLGTLTTGEGSSTCQNTGIYDMRVFNFSRDFTTVTYYVALREDNNPDARPNSPTNAKRVIPVLMRRENGGAAHGGSEQELVQGVDQLTFRYGVQDSQGNTRFLSAGEIASGAGLACPKPPDGVAEEPGCLWRAVRLIEAHLLVNTVDEIMGLDDISRTYHYMDADHATASSTALPSGLNAGSMLRREFIAYVSNRNYNF